MAIGDERNLDVNTKELVRCKLVSPKDGLAFSVDTDAFVS